jgi:hypothetical protein
MPDLTPTMQELDSRGGPVEMTFADLRGLLGRPEFHNGRYALWRSRDEVRTHVFVAAFDDGERCTTAIWQ